MLQPNQADAGHAHVVHEFGSERRGHEPGQYVRRDAEVHQDATVDDAPDDWNHLRIPRTVALRGTSNAGRHCTPAPVYAGAGLGRLSEQSPPDGTPVDA